MKNRNNGHWSLIFEDVADWPRDRLAGKRIRNVMEKLECYTLRDFTQYTWQDLIRVKGCGRKTIEEIMKIMSRDGLHLKQSCH